MRPDVALAFDRMAAAARGRPASSSPSRAASAPMPSRRGCSPPTRTRSGSRRRGEPAPLRHRARPRAAGRVRLARGERAAVRLRAAVPLGAVALGLHARHRQLVGGLRRPRRRRRGHPRRPVVRPGAVRAADRPRGPALERVGPAARRSALRRVRLQPVRPLTRRRRGHRAVHARHGRRDGPRSTRSTPTPPSTPRRT